MVHGIMQSGGPGGLSDGSWTLTVFVTDLQVERSLRVRGDLHIGGVMIRLVDELGKTKKMYSFDIMPTTLPSHKYSLGCGVSSYKETYILFLKELLILTIYAI